MTKFNPENKELLTYGEALDPAMKITDKADAQQYLADYIAYTQAQMDKEPRDDDKTAEWVVKQNIGYWTGYYDSETAKRVQELFECAHPVFGKASAGSPTPEEAFKAGVKAAKEANG